jgi:hypothetical protein
MLLPTVTLRVALLQSEAPHAPPFHVERGPDHRTSRFVDPHVTPVPKVELRTTGQHRDQIVPGRVAERMPPKVLAYAIAEGGLTQ